MAKTTRNVGLAFQARYAGACACGARICKGDTVRFTAKKVTSCPCCVPCPRSAGEKGVGWTWAYHLGPDHEKLAKLYLALRAAYMVVPLSTDGGRLVLERTDDSIRGLGGRQFASEEGFDQVCWANLVAEGESWSGVTEFTRLTVPQGLVMRAANLLHQARSKFTDILPSPETLEWGGFLGGELIWSGVNAAEAINAIVIDVYGAALAE